MFVSLFLMLTAAELYNTAHGRIVSKPPRRTRYCLSAIYSYGVVSTELFCEFLAFRKNGSTTCTDGQVSLLCEYEGDDPRHVQCDPLVGTYSLTHYKRFMKQLEKGPTAWTVGRGYPYEHYAEKKRGSVHWVMEPDSNPAYSYKRPGGGLVQRVYRVNDTDVEEDHCASLKVAVYDIAMDTSPREATDMNLVTLTTTRIPLPGENGVRGGEWFIYSAIYQTQKMDILMKVNFMVRYEHVRFACHHPRGMDTYGTHYDSPDDRVQEDGIKVLKEAMDIAPAEIAMFNQPVPTSRYHTQNIRSKRRVLHRNMKNSRLPTHPD